jgi:hypothetical protein
MASFLFNGLAAEMGEDRLCQMALIWMAEVDARNRLKDEFLAAGRAAADRLQELLRAGPLFPPGFRFREDHEEEQEEQEESVGEQASVISPFAASAADGGERAATSSSSIPPPPPQHPEDALDGWPEIEIDLEAGEGYLAYPRPPPFAADAALGEGAPLSPESVEPRPLFAPEVDQEGMNELLQLLGLQQPAEDLAAARPPSAEEAEEAEGAAEEPRPPARLLQHHVLRASQNILEIVAALRTGALRSEKPGICWGPRSKNFPSAPMPATVLQQIRENGPQSVKNLQKLLLDDRLAADQREAQQTLKQMTLQGILVLA